MMLIHNTGIDLNLVPGSLIHSTHENFTMVRRLSYLGEPDGCDLPKADVTVVELKNAAALLTGSRFFAQPSHNQRLPIA
jgi:hypothetical protein